MTLKALLAGVSLLGLAYIPFDHYVLGSPWPAEQCRIHRSVIDSVVSEWEARHVELRAGATPLVIEFDENGRVQEISPALSALPRGDFGIAQLAEDSQLFGCPGWSLQAHYRWILARDPQAELGGERRGVVCPVHGGGL